MISGIWNFIKRHKKKFIFLGSFAGGGWLMYRYILKKVQEIRDAEEKQYLLFIRRQHHFDSNQRTCNMTVLSMVPNLREILQRNMDVDAVKEMLKSNPSNKLELWDELKIMSVTRAFAAVYGVSMLSVMLRVQLNIVGGYMYLESIHQPGDSKPESGEGNAPKIPQKVQERYLSIVKEFIEQGFLDFINGLKLAVVKEFGSISLKEPLRLDNLSSIFGHVRERIECGVDKPTISLYPYLIKCEQVPVSDSKVVVDQEDELYERLVGETRDILESYDFHSVLKSSIDRGFSCIMDVMADHFQEIIPQNESDTSIHDISLAMAKLIPLFSSLLPKICGDAPNPFIQELLLMEDLKQLAANVYEAFSQESTTSQPALEHV